MSGNRPRPSLMRSTREIAARRARWRGLRREMLETERPDRDAEAKPDAQGGRAED